MTLFDLLLDQTVTFELNLWDALMDLTAFAVGSIIPISCLDKAVMVSEERKDEGQQQH